MQIFDSLCIHKYNYNLDYFEFSSCRVNQILNITLDITNSVDTTRAL